MFQLSIGINNTLETLNVFKEMGFHTEFFSEKVFMFENLYHFSNECETLSNDFSIENVNVVNFELHSLLLQNSAECCQLCFPSPLEYYNFTVRSVKKLKNLPSIEELSNFTDFKACYELIQHYFNVKNDVEHLTMVLRLNESSLVSLWLQKAKVFKDNFYSFLQKSNYVPLFNYMSERNFFKIKGFKRQEAVRKFNITFSEEDAGKQFLLFVELAPKNFNGLHFEFSFFLDDLLLTSGNKILFLPVWLYPFWLPFNNEVNYTAEILVPFEMTPERAEITLSLLKPLEDKIHYLRNGLLEQNFQKQVEEILEASEMLSD